MAVVLRTFAADLTVTNSHDGEVLFFNLPAFGQGAGEFFVTIPFGLFDGFETKICYKNADNNPSSQPLLKGKLSTQYKYVVPGGDNPNTSAMPEWGGGDNIPPANTYFNFVYGKTYTFRVLGSGSNTFLFVED